MGNIPPELFQNILIYLTIPFVFGYIFKKLNISPVIGYILAGIVIGNFFGNLIASNNIDNFASFGIILLLFTIGLEVNFEKIVTVKKFIILGGLLQILFSSVFIMLLSMVFKFNIIQAFLIGIAFSSSSTSLVAKIIQERGEESSFVGELTFGLLMLQDIAFIPFVILFSLLSTHANSPIEAVKSIVGAIVEVVVILSLMVYLGKKIVPFIFDRVGKSSRELLDLFIILFIVFIGFISTIFHVPILIGVYVAGVLVSQTLEHHHIFSQIRPIRDILAIIFFIFIGTHIHIGEIAGLLPSIVLFSFLVSFAKFIIFLGIFVYFRFNSRIAFSIATYLFQVSEYAFILMSLAFAAGIFTEQQYLFTASAVLISLILTPLLINSKERLYLVIRSILKKYIPSVASFIHLSVNFDRSPLDTLEIKDHVVICGYGRIGSHIGRALLLANIPFIAIDYNFHAVAKAKKEGVPIIYGDPTDIDILDYAQLEHALVMVAVIPDKYSQEAILLNAKKLNPSIYIISRVHKAEHQQRMRDLGAHVVVQPEIEASLSIIKRLFLIKNIPKEDIVNKLHHFRVELGVVG